MLSAYAFIHSRLNCCTVTVEMKKYFQKDRVPGPTSAKDLLYCHLHERALLLPSKPQKHPLRQLLNFMGKPITVLLSNAIFVPFRGKRRKGQVATTTVCAGEFYSKSLAVRQPSRQTG